MLSKAEVEAWTIRADDAGLLARDLKAAMEALKNIMPFREHGSGCEIDHTDFCSCGLIVPASTANRLLAAYHGRPEVAFKDCKNPECPVSCPDSHCLPFEDALAAVEERTTARINKYTRCSHDHLDIDGTCHSCGQDCRGAQP